MRQTCTDHGHSATKDVLFVNSWHIRGCPSKIALWDTSAAPRSPFRLPSSSRCVTLPKRDPPATHEGETTPRSDSTMGAELTGPPGHVEQVPSRTQRSLGWANRAPERPRFGKFDARGSPSRRFLRRGGVPDTPSRHAWSTGAVGLPHAVHPSDGWSCLRDRPADPTLASAMAGELPRFARPGCRGRPRACAVGRWRPVARPRYPARRC